MLEIECSTSMKLLKKNLTKLRLLSLSKWGGICFPIAYFYSSPISLWYFSIRMDGVNSWDSGWMNLILSAMRLWGTWLIGVSMMKIIYCRKDILSLVYLFFFFIRQMSIGSRKESIRYSYSLNMMSISMNSRLYSLVSISLSSADDFFLGLTASVTF